MMNKISIAAILLILFTNQIFANNDSLFVNTDSIVPCEETQIIIDSCTEVNNEKNIVLNETYKPAKPKISKLKTNNKPEGLGDFLNDLWDIISSPFKPVWGYYEEENMNNEGPYFMFNRMENNNFKNK